MRVLLAKLGLDVHNRGILTVAKMLEDDGIEVIYIGNGTPKEIVTAAIQEAVDAVGVSSMAGAHIVLGQQLKELAKKEDIPVIIGGVFPPADVCMLKNMGYSAVICPGDTREMIIKAFRNI